MSKEIQEAKLQLANIGNDDFFHGPFTPADIREGEPYRCTLKFLDQLIDCSIWKLSPLAIELVISEDIKNLEIGGKVDIDINLGKQISKYRGLLLSKENFEHGRRIIGIRLFESQPERTSDVSRRNEKRWTCSSEFVPTGVSVNPFKFNDFIYFRIKDISSGGLMLATSLRNKFILKGLRFECTFNFPTVGQAHVKFEVNNVRLINENGKDSLGIGVVLVKDYQSRFNELCAQYLLQYSNVSSLTEFKENNFSKPQVTRAIQFRYVKSLQDYEDVLKLRKVAYVLEGKARPDCELKDMITPYDSNARIVMGFFKDQLVVSGAVIFHSKETLTEQEEFFAWPDTFPSKEKLIEVNRACTHPDFRGAQLLIEMYKFITVFIMQAAREDVILCADDNLTPLYKKLGFVDTGMRYSHASLGNIPHNILLGKIFEGATGKRVGPITWNIVYGDIISYLKQYDQLPSDPWMETRIAFYRLFRPIANYMLKRKLTKSNHQQRKLNDSADRKSAIESQAS